jgi:hypothetical protein
MELKRIYRGDSPDGVWINSNEFDPSIHREWIAPPPELPQTVEIAGLQEPIAVDPPKKHPNKRKVIADDLASTK